jgi:hypothetical protein
MWELLVEGCELVEVGSKETKCVNVRCNMSMRMGFRVERRRADMILTQKLPRLAQIRRK